MTVSGDGIRVRADVTNPGQFFACCGLFELTDRLAPGCQAGFTDDGYLLIEPADTSAPLSLERVIAELHDAEFRAIAPDDLAATPILVPGPFGLLLDWWNDTRSRGSELKTWAGQQKVFRIAQAMQATLLEDDAAGESLLERNAVLYEAESRAKKVEPFYFDSRRAAQAHAVDIGFSPDTQRMEMPVHGTVELLCLIGLQRFRPRANEDRTRSYQVWRRPLPIVAAAAVASCGAEMPGSAVYKFRLLYRTKYLKGFLPSQPEGDE